VGYWALRCPKDRSQCADLIVPGIFFGKGFGDLPDNLAWLRPFGITGALTLEHPARQ
jgi:hypothetical protein